MSQISKEPEAAKMHATPVSTSVILIVKLKTMIKVGCLMSGLLCYTGLRQWLNDKRSAKSSAVPMV